MTSSFGLLNKNTGAALGAVAEATGQRPSSFFNWNEEDDWFARLMFDINVIRWYNVKQSEAVQDGKNR